MNPGEHIEDLINKQSQNHRNIELKWNDQKLKSGMLENNGT